MNRDEAAKVQALVEALSNERDALRTATRYAAKAMGDNDGFTHAVDEADIFAARGAAPLAAVEAMLGATQGCTREPTPEQKAETARALAAYLESGVHDEDR